MPRLHAIKLHFYWILRWKNLNMSYTLLCNALLRWLSNKMKNFIKCFYYYLFRKPADLHNLAPGTHPPFLTFNGEVKTDINQDRGVSGGGFGTTKVSSFLQIHLRQIVTV